MKAILVIDQPEDCTECPLYSEDDYGYGCGYGTGENRRQTNVDDTIPAWCPLKPMPEKLVESKVEWGESRGYQGGWNACIEEIGLGI